MQVLTVKSVSFSFQAFISLIIQGVRKHVHNSKNHKKLSNYCIAGQFALHDFPKHRMFYGKGKKKCSNFFNYIFYKISDQVFMVETADTTANSYKFLKCEKTYVILWTILSFFCYVIFRFLTSVNGVNCTPMQQLVDFSCIFEIYTYFGSLWAIYFFLPRKLSLFDESYSVNLIKIHFFDNYYGINTDTAIC